MGIVWFLMYANLRSPSALYIRKPLSIGSLAYEYSSPFHSGTTNATLPLDSPTSSHAHT